MGRDTDGIRRKNGEAPALDEVDRKLLGLLAEDATLTYAELGKRLNLSAPAVHERARRLKQAGVIQRTVAVLDANLVGKPLLAFVHVDTEGWGKSPAMMALALLPKVEEIHSVSGDACLILKVRTAGPGALDDVLARIYAVPGVQNTRSYVALRSHLERGVSPATGLEAPGTVHGDKRPH